MIERKAADGGMVYPREIKSAMTYTKGMGRHLDEFVAMVPNARNPLVVYAGETFPGQAVNYQEEFA